MAEWEICTQIPLGFLSWAYVLVCFLNIPRKPYVEGLVTSLWCYSEVVETLGSGQMEGSEVFEAVPSPFCFIVLPSCHEVRACSITWYAASPQAHEWSQLTMNWNFFNCEPKQIFPPFKLIKYFVTAIESWLTQYIQWELQETSRMENSRWEATM